MDSDPESRRFGFREVDPGEKAGMVRRVFDSVAPRYDLMNDLMSGGIHRLWKDELVRAVRPRPGEACVDVAGGTGDVAFRLLRAAGGRGDGEGGVVVHVVDINEQMLRVGRDRAIDRGFLAGVDFAVGDAERLPLPDRSADVYTIAFGLRNVTRIDAALAEARRVLRPGGRFFCLEFSKVRLPPLARLYDLYSFRMLPLLGRVVADDPEAYRYLAESIRVFPDQPALAARMEAAGLSRARWTNLSGGIAAIHSAWRI